MESLPSTRPVALDPRSVAPVHERERRQREPREPAGAHRDTPEPAEPARAAATGDEPGAHLDVTA